MTTVVLVQQGGTGSNNASDARSALGAAPTAAYDQANAAFAAANSGSSSAGAAYNQANAAYTQANTARSDANTTFATVNTTFGTVNTSVSTANTQANSGRDQANAAYGQANTSYGQANSARDQANTAYGQANLAYTQANSAFTAANNSNLKSGGIISGTLNVTNDIIVGGNVYLQGNTTFINVSTYQVNDPLMYIAANNTLTDSVDIGFIGAKNTSGTFSHTGLARDATDGKYKLFDGLPDNDHIGNVINFANTYLATLVANVEANTLRVVNSVTGNVNFDSGTLFVDSVNDRVGVGTTTPSYKLHVAGTGYTSGNFTSGGIIETLTTVQSSSGSDLSLNANGANRDVFFKVNSSTLAMVQGSTGNFGVGTASPSSKLSVGGNPPLSGILAGVSAANGISLALSDNTNSSFYVKHPTGSPATIGTDAGGALAFATNGFTERMRIDSSGNVGIGVTPTNKLHLYGSGQTFRIEQNPGVAGNSLIYVDSAGAANYAALRLSGAWMSVRTDFGNDLQIGPDATRANGKVFINTSTGNVAIGTSNTASKLYVKEGSNAIEVYPSGIWAGQVFNANDGSTSHGLVVGNRWAGTASSIFEVGSLYGGGVGSWRQFFKIDGVGQVFFSNEGSERMRINTSGNVGIGTTSPSTKLDVSGTITCTALTETSSITFKENVDPIQNALNSITKLVGVTYDRKDGSAKQKAGLIAEEVNEVLPNLVQKDADGNAYGIHYTNLIAYLVESIKELNNKIERLESNR